MTYRELLEKLQKLGEDKLDRDIHIYDYIMGCCYSGEIDFASCANDSTKMMGDEKLNCLLNDGNPVIINI
jgi:hypothetical protein